MTRTPTGDAHHRPKDLCTLEQAAELAVKAARVEVHRYMRQQAAVRQWNRPHRRLVRWCRLTLARLRARKAAA